MAFRVCKISVDSSFTLFSFWVLDIRARRYVSIVIFLAPAGEKARIEHGSDPSYTTLFISSLLHCSTISTYDLRASETSEAKSSSYSMLTMDMVILGEVSA
jgi:hypothetical protein